MDFSFSAYAYSVFQESRVVFSDESTNSGHAEVCVSSRMEFHRYSQLQTFSCFRASRGKRNSTQCHFRFCMISHKQSINYKPGLKHEPENYSEDLNTKNVTHQSVRGIHQTLLFSLKIERDKLEKTPPVSKAAAELFSMQ